MGRVTEVPATAAASSPITGPKTASPESRAIEEPMMTEEPRDEPAEDGTFKFREHNPRTEAIADA